MDGTRWETTRHDTGAQRHKKRAAEKRHGPLKRERIDILGNPSLRGEIGVIPGAYDRPGDIYVRTDAGCYYAAYSSAALDFTVHGPIPESGVSNALFIRSRTAPGAATYDAKERKTAEFTRCEKKVAMVLRPDRGIGWNRPFQFRPFGMKTYGYFGPQARNAE